MMQIWKRLGLIYAPDGALKDIHSHAAVPLISEINGDIARIYFTARDVYNRSLMTYLDLDLTKFQVVYQHNLPVFTPGAPGFFDEDGVMGCDIAEIYGRRLVYYIGWNRASSVPFRNALGLAELCGDKLVRLSDGPALDRSQHDPCFVASCCVVPADGGYLMYYLSCIRWEIRAGSWTPYYHIKIARSVDGLRWIPTGQVAIDFKYPNEYAISVPRVVHDDGRFRMWYSYRGGVYSDGYRIGYAESDDGLAWERRDELVRFSGRSEGWDSDIQCYSYIFSHRGQRYMLYNGNGYGATGFGVAVLEG